MNSVHICQNNNGDLPVTLVLIKAGNSKLQLVKSIKVFTGLGLMESKNIVDAIENQPQIIKINTTHKDLKELKSGLDSCIELQYSLSDIQDNRNKKIIQLGLGTKKDLVELLVEKDMYSIYSQDYYNIKNFLIERYSLISEKDLLKLLDI